MPRPPLPFESTAAHLRITAWHDPALDAVGHDVRSAYVEQFWLPILGPTTLLLVRRLCSELECHPQGFDLDLEQTAAALGLSIRDGLNGPFYRALARTAQFHITRSNGPAALAARMRVQTLSHRQIARLSPSLQRSHTDWQVTERGEPTDEQRRLRARRLALSLLELGEPLEAAERQLHRWKIHPAVAHEALRWASERRSATPQVTAADATLRSPA